MIHYLAQFPFPLIILSNLTYFYQIFYNDDIVYVKEITFYLRYLQAFPLFCQTLIGIAHHQIMKHALKGKELKYPIKSHLLYHIAEFLLFFSFSTGAYIFIPTCYVLTKQIFTKNFVFWVSPKPQSCNETSTTATATTTTTTTTTTTNPPTWKP